MNYAQRQTLLSEIECRLLRVCLGPQSTAIDSLDVLACFFLGTPWTRASRWQNQDHEPWTLHFFALLSTLGCVLLSWGHKCHHQQKWPSILFPTHFPPPAEFHRCLLFLFIITCSETKTPQRRYLIGYSMGCELSHRRVEMQFSSVCRAFLDLHAWIPGFKPQYHINSSQSSLASGRWI